MIEKHHRFPISAQVRQTAGATEELVLKGLQYLQLHPPTDATIPTALFGAGRSFHTHAHRPITCCICGRFRSFPRWLPSVRQDCAAPVPSSSELVVGGRGHGRQRVRVLEQLAGAHVDVEELDDFEISEILGCSRARLQQASTGLLGTPSPAASIASSATTKRGRVSANGDVRTRK